MDIKRNILWAVFTLSLLLLWDNWSRFNGKPSLFLPVPASTIAPSPVGSKTTPAAKNDVPQTSTGGSAANTVPAAGAESPATAPVQSELITITTDIVKADIDTLGGNLKRLELLHHKDTDPTKNVVLFDASASRTYLAETGLIGGDFPNHKSSFVAKPGSRTLDRTNQVQLVLEAEQGGVKLTKTYTFKRGDYKIEVNHTVTNNSIAPVAPSLYLQLVRDGNKPAGESAFYSTFTGPAIYTEAEHFQKLDFKKIEERKEEHATKADNGWIALIQHYFVSAFLPPEKAPRENFTKKIDTNLYAVGTILPLGAIAPNATTSMNASLYSGPEESTVLEKIAGGLELVKDYGWLTIIAKPIFWLMMQIHKVSGNWGWTIILLTVMIKLAFFPLSAASYRSMAKMKKVTPKMQSIRERFKSEPQKMNQAMMELYKTEKINPLGGCLPIVVQIPVFISLYWVLLASVEMRHASWAWIHDLAAPDSLFGTIHIVGWTIPVGILPILMAISMFIQTKLNPTPPDPIQAKVMMFMPIIFSAMFFFFPSGLVLYWVVNNVLSIAQQWVITKNMETGKAA
jgi:YidC/Oxa1 family membrane protein insertase